MEDRKGKIIIALDFSDIDKAREIVKELIPYTNWFKIGSELVLAAGARDSIKMVKDLGGRVFLDCKFNDISNTVLRSIEVVRDLGVDMCTVHASVGRETLSYINQKKGDMKIIVVTVLTSLDDAVAQEIFGKDVRSAVIKFNEIAEETMCDGVVCSAEELKFIKDTSTRETFIRITPGIRPSWSVKDDQKRVLTPREAFNNGADFIVIGRPITSPPEEIGGSAEAAQMVINEL